MQTEVWFRNPQAYIRELVECNQGNIVWDRGVLVKRGVDPNAHAMLHFGTVIPYRILAVGPQGAAELDATHAMGNPKAVYPVWQWGIDSIEQLEDLMENNVGDDIVVCNTPGIPKDELPVYGQEHRVVITDIPNVSTFQGKSFMRTLKMMQEDFPDAIVHVHGLYSWRMCFGVGLRAADVDPRVNAAKGNVTLPSGKEVRVEQLIANVNWVRALGFMPEDMKIPRNRCMYNIKSALWAGEHYAELYNFPVNGSSAPVDTTTPRADYKGKATTTIFKRDVKPLDGDKFVCDSCSLANSCKYYRDGAVCSVPGSEPTDLAAHFQTRDAGVILDGLALLLRSGAKRYETGLQVEAITDELIPEVSRVQGQLFDQGVKLAKLLDPSLRGGAKVQVNVGSGSAVQVNNGNPRQLITEAFKELESRGISRDDITPDMIEKLLNGSSQSPLTIEGAVVESGS